MPTTRDFKSLGVVASDAQEVTEDGTRVVGEYYRRTNLSDNVQIEGELFDVNPKTENLNQKVFNSSSFTDTMDTRGIVGWTNLVDYSPPSIVWASDGLVDSGDFYICLRDSGPASVIVDPITDNQEAPLFWRILQNPEQLRLDLANETPGSEGARLSGYNKFDVNGGVDVGLTVKTALDNAFNAIIGSQDFEILASCAVTVESDNAIPPAIISVFANSHFNVLAAGFSPIPSDDGIGNPTEFAQGTRVTFTSPIPTPYNAQACIFEDFSNPDVTGTRDVISYGDKLSTHIDIYQRQIDFNSGPSRPNFHSFSLICYRYNP